MADFHERSVAVLAHDLESAPGFGARFVNVHAGSHRGAGVGGRRRSGSPTASRGSSPPPTTARTPRSSSWRTRPAAATRWDRRSRSSPTSPRPSPRAASTGDRVAFCLDAAHAWGAGYRISEPDEVDALVDRFDALIGLDRLRDGPPQRHAVRARARGPTATSTSARARSVRRAWRGC